uniref:Gustatory receptor n=1 Tax=Panagrellus redivivus TaxID=6233 RepID=A0A7E4VX86_PANRE
MIVTLIVIGFFLGVIGIFCDNGILITWPLFTVILVIQACLFFHVITKNKQMYQRRVLFESRMNLSQRYQLSENLRIIRFMQNTSTIYWSCNIVMLLTFVAYIACDDLYFTIVFHYIWIWEGYITSCMIVGIFMSTGAWPTVGQLCRQCRTNPLNPTNNKIVPIRTSMGEQMMFANDQEADVYFNQLMKSWDRPEKKISSIKALVFHEIPQPVLHPNPNTQPHVHHE